MPSSAPTTPPGTPPSVRRPLLAGAAGNFVEWFDFGVYGFQATVIATAFFPGHDPTAGLLATFGIFAVAFFIRPVGAIVLGRLGDRVGRRATLSLVVLMMSGSTALVGVLPTHASVGTLAPVLLLVLRLVQGFSAGGEYSGASAFVVEYAPRERRGLYASVLSMSTNAASLCGLGLAALLTQALGDTAMQSWGWRIPFLLALPLGLVGLYLRLRVDDTPEFLALRRDAEVESAPLKATWHGQRRAIGVVFGVVTFNAVAFYVLGSYWPTYLTSVVGLPRTTALWSSAATYLVLIALVPVFGHLSDRYGRRPLMTYAACGLTLLAVPAFLLSSVGGFWPAFAGQLLFVSVAGATGPVVTVLLVEMFPTNVRYTASSIGYNLSYLVFGGTAPYVATFLISRTGSNLSPAVYITVIALVSLLVIRFCLPETAPRAVEPAAETAGSGAVTTA
ncbi:MFS transporter [Streptomyces sp. OE57]|uniref:MFS transporter n=1 Tax=Streptomyces lacaronensis TaxID=3379885 RepID=UPI0039B73079